MATEEEMRQEIMIAQSQCTICVVALLESAGMLHLRLFISLRRLFIVHVNGELLAVKSL